MSEYDWTAWPCASLPSPISPAAPPLEELVYAVAAHFAVKLDVAERWLRDMRWGDER